MITYFINCFILFFLLIMLFTFLSYEELASILSKYKNGQIIYFLAPTKNNLIAFIQLGALAPAIIEEIIFRGPIWFLVYYEIKFKDPRFNLIFLLLAIPALSYAWAIPHTFALPIFIVGIPAYILVIKTKNIFAPMLCHFISNLSIYILLQISLYFKII